MYEQGEKVTIQRGTHRGQSAEVLSADESGQTYAVKLADGGLAVINAVNVREPVEATISASALAEAFGTITAEFGQDTIEALEKAAPGITARFITARFYASA